MFSAVMPWSREAASAQRSGPGGLPAQALWELLPAAAHNEETLSQRFWTAAPAIALGQGTPKRGGCTPPWARLHHIQLGTPGAVQGGATAR